jgi:hypothetical protein
MFTNREIDEATEIKESKRLIKKIVKETDYYKNLARHSYRNSKKYSNYDDTLVSLAMLVLEIKEPEKLWIGGLPPERKRHITNINLHCGIQETKVLRPYWLHDDLVKAFVATKPPTNLYLKTRELSGVMFLPLSCAPIVHIENREESVKWFFYRLTPSHLLMAIDTDVATLFHSIDRISLEDLKKTNELQIEDDKSLLYFPNNNTLEKKSIIQSRSHLISLAAQTLLYIENYQPELLPNSGRNQSKDRVPKQKAVKKILPTGLIVGDNYRIKRENSECGKPIKTDTPAYSVQTHWRSGHWRNQPYGERNNPQYKTIWIEPILINPDNPQG